eukprot:8204769-Pyramimonas_sp.AAC.1
MTACPRSMRASAFFMGDISKTQLAPTGVRTAKEAATLSQRNDAGLDQALAAKKYGQNRSEQG